jgi:hypothetical protein
MEQNPLGTEYTSSGIQEDIPSPVDEFRNNFYKVVADEKRKKEAELKRKQKQCFHKYSRFIPYHELLVAVCESCGHAKFVKV